MTETSPGPVRRAETPRHIEATSTETIPHTVKPTTSTPLQPEIVTIPHPEPVARSPEVATIHPAFKLREFNFRKKFFRFFGGEYDVYDQNQKRVLHSEQERFKLKEKFHVYPDKKNKKEEELLSMNTDQILDTWATYKISDPKNNTELGKVKREWLHSILKDKWTIMSPDNKEIGRLEESSTGRAIASRLFGWLVPQRYDIKSADGTILAKIKQRFNPFVLKYNMKVEKPDVMDPRLMVGMGILLTGIEGRQNSGSPSINLNSAFSSNS